MSWICNSDMSFQKVKIRTSDDHTQQEKKGTSLQGPLEHNLRWGHLLLRWSRVTPSDGLVVLQVPLATGKNPPRSHSLSSEPPLPARVFRAGGHRFPQTLWEIALESKGWISAPVLAHLHSHMPWPAASLQGFPWPTAEGIWPDLEVTYPRDGLTQQFPLNPGLLQLQKLWPGTFLSRCRQELIFISFCYEGVEG